MDNKKTLMRNPRIVILTLRLTTDWGSKQALSRSSALSPQELSVHRTQQVLSSHLTAGNLSINLSSWQATASHGTPLSDKGYREKAHV